MRKPTFRVVKQLAQGRTAGEPVSVWFHSPWSASFSLDPSGEVRPYLPSGRVGKAGGGQGLLLDGAPDGFCARAPRARVMRASPQRLVLLAGRTGRRLTWKFC